jgi:cell wall-associated NlpC family hydrolase
LPIAYGGCNFGDTGVAQSPLGNAFRDCHSPESWNSGNGEAPRARAGEVEFEMRRVHTIAIAIGLALLTAAPGVASADTYTGQANRQQYINVVITRALSQRGVPFAYGGGNATGPTRGVDRAAVPGTNPTATPLGAVPNVGVAPAIPNTAVPPVTPNTGLGLVTVPGASPDPSANVVGFDASGLMVYAYAGVGIKLPRSSGEQYNFGRKVLPAQALPGDLLFYGPDGSQSVALFAGNGQMVEVTDTGVQLSAVRTDGMAPYLARIIA